MNTAALTGFSIIFIIAAAFVAFVVIRKVLKLAIKLALIAALLLTLALGAGVWWWKGGVSNEAPTNRSTTPRRSANR